MKNYRKIEKELRNLIEISELLKIELDDEMAKEVTKNTKKKFSQRNRKIGNSNIVFWKI